jgi:D-alanine-D-alanine ligase and related ATP-grasp enzymes
MKIGLTYDLRHEYLAMGYSAEETAELDTEDTIEGLEQALGELGCETERIGHARALMRQLLKGKRWDMVFNICEGMHGDGRESLVPALLDAFQIPYVFSGANTMALSLNKAVCKRVVRDAGIPTPDFCLICSEADLRGGKPPFPLFVKPVSEGTGKGISEQSIITGEEQYIPVCTDLLRRFHQPVLVESYLPGREFTAGIVGNGTDARIIGVMEVVFRPSVREIYSYEAKQEYEKKVVYRNITGELSGKCERLALQVWEVTGARDGGRVDMKLNAASEPEFLEINPLPGLNSRDSDLPILARLNGMGFTELIAAIMHAAQKRVYASAAPAQPTPQSALHNPSLPCRPPA